MQTIVMDSEVFIGVSQEYASFDEDPGFEKVWFGQYMPKSDSLTSLSVDGAVYGIQIVLSNARCKYFAGVKVRAESETPKGTETLIVEAGNYVMRKTSVQEIGEEWDRLESDLSGSDIKEDKKRPRIEQYLNSEDSASENMRVFIYMPVTE